MKRAWLIIIARRPTDVYCFTIDDGPFAADHAATVPSNHIVCSCLANVVEKYGGDASKRPSSLVVCPLGVAAFRTKHARQLASNLSLVLGTGIGGGAGAVSVSSPAECFELPDDATGSICGNGLKTTILDMVTEPVWLTFQDLIEQEVELYEEKMNKKRTSPEGEMSVYLGGYHEKSRYSEDPSHGINRKAAVESLCDLFDACKTFHDMAPWKTLSNNEYLILRDETTGEKAYAMVSNSFFSCCP